jgi:predicted PurR-regulated permease PerM
MNNPVIKYLLNNQFLAALIVIAIIWLAIQLSGILILVFISFIIMAALAPFSDYLVKKRFPRIFAVIIPYSITIAVLVLLIFPLIPLLGSQIQLLFKNFPKYIDQVAKILNLHTNSNTNFLGSDISTIGINAISVTGKIFSGVFSALTVFVISFYFMLQREKLKKQFSSLCPKKYQEHVLNTIVLIENKIGYWLRGQLILCFAIGLVTWIGLALIGLP